MMFDGQGHRRAFAVRLSLFYGAVFLIYGTQLPYLSVWLESRQLSPAEIGVVTSLPLFARLVFTPSVALIADRRGAHRLIVIALAWAALASAVALVHTTGVVAIAIVVLAFLVTAQSTMPLAETIAMRGVRGGGLDYGRMRLWGSLTFVAANLIGGWWLARAGADAVAAMLVLGSMATVAAAHMLPIAPSAGADADQSGSRRIGWDAALRLLADGRFRLLMLATGTIQASHAVYYAFGTLHWQSTGIAAGWYGILWAIGVLVEVALFAVSGRAVAIAGAQGLLVIGGIAALARWTMMATDPSLLPLIALQVLHGVTFGATHLAAMHLIAQLVPEREAGTAQALHATVTAGVAMGAAMIVAGYTYARWHGSSYLVMAALAACGLVAALMLTRSMRAGAGPAG